MRFGRVVRACARPLFLMGETAKIWFRREWWAFWLPFGNMTRNARSASALMRRYVFETVCSPLLRQLPATSILRSTAMFPLIQLFLTAPTVTRERTVDQRQGNPEALFIHQEDMQERMNRIYSQLSPLETRILRLYLSGLSYSEIASKCNRPLKSVDNAVQRIRRKIARQSEQGESSQR